jgi:hypothetical protein
LRLGAEILCDAIASHEPQNVELRSRGKYTLVPTARSFYDKDGWPVQELEARATLEDWGLFVMYVLMKLSPPTTEYREFLWGMTIGNTPFTSLGQNGSWFTYQQPQTS